MPLLLILGFGNLVALALQQSGVSVALSVLQFGVPVIAGYETRRQGGTYGNALRTAWLTILVSLVVVGIPLIVVGLLTGVAPIQVPPGLHLDTTSYIVAALALAVVLPIVAVIVWVVWIPFTLIGAWIADRPAAPPPAGAQPAVGTPAIVEVIDWIAAFVIAFDVGLQVLFRAGLDPNAVIFPGGGSGPPPTGEVVVLLGLLVIGLLVWPSIAWIVIRVLIWLVRRVRTWS